MKKCIINLILVLLLFSCDLGSSNNQLQPDNTNNNQNTPNATTPGTNGIPGAGTPAAAAAAAAKAAVASQKISIQISKWQNLGINTNFTHTIDKYDQSGDAITLEIEKKEGKILVTKAYANDSSRNELLFEVLVNEITKFKNAMKSGSGKFKCKKSSDGKIIKETDTEEEFDVKKATDSKDQTEYILLDFLKKKISYAIKKSDIKEQELNKL